MKEALNTHRQRKSKDKGMDREIANKKMGVKQRKKN
jgi:hypothetical protein